jgi:hypothetical protein
MDTLFLVLILSTALVLGNEFSVAAFIHPSLARAGHLRFLPAIQIFASLFGKIMPFWMTSTFVLHLVLLAATWRWPSLRSLLLSLAAAMWLVIIVFSLVGPVPINERVKAWTVDKLPADWERQRWRWDAMNAIRVVMIAAAFMALVAAYKDY